MSSEQTVNLLVLASYYKGVPFLEEAHRQGANVYFLTREKMKDENWPDDAITERFLMPKLSQFPDILHAVSYLTRDRQIDRIVPMDDYDVLIAAALREHLRLPGMGDSATRIFRDKLAMRVKARELGLPVPDFIHVLNHQQLHQFSQTVPAPWVLKPRTEAGAMGIKKVHNADELWQRVNQLGDEQSGFLLEQFVPGDIFHVDSITHNGKVVFTSVQKYGRPPMNVAHDGGVFISYTLSRQDDDYQPLVDFNEEVILGLGMHNGVTHTEFIKAHADGKLYFLETAARVGGASIDQLVEAASGLNLWGEWARLEIALAQGKPYELPTIRQDYAGILVCLAKQEYPDMSAYSAPEVVWKLDKKQHAGLIVASNDADRVHQLINEYSQRFAHDFLAVAPPLDKPPE
ncbi:MAG TPA: ATP-grasp domain-containing protein [Anaerolineae bacterium]|nr:ATP-grasp domain-containing protein [Anaerolineae bacterium]